ncbi:MAG: hypothetical protein M0P70_02365 [Desulfobulbaceae bacterium]|nr:hypothetical protein [Desulfobulbaceae bacterium]
MTKNDLPTDQQYLKTLIRDLSLRLPKAIVSQQEKRASESVDELIMKGRIDPKDRQYYIDFNLAHINPETAFQGSALTSLKSRTLAYLAGEEAVFEVVPVGMLSIPEMNAFAIRTPRGGAAIALYSGLWLFLKIAFYALLAIMYRKTEYSIGAHHSNETYAANLYSVVNAMKSGSIIIMTTTGEHSIADCVGDGAWPEQMVAQNIQYALSFILLHEFGHIHHGHLDINLTRRMSAGKRDVDIYLTSHKQEFEADEFAVRRILLKGERNLVHNVLHMTSITMLFLLFDLCEDDNFPETLGTHPKSKRRLERVYTVCKDWCGESTWMQLQEATGYVEAVFEILKKHK